MSSTTTFAPSVVISTGIEKALTSMAGDSMIALVRVLAEKYNFDAEDTIRELGLTEIQVTKKKRTPKEPNEKKEKKVKEVKPPRDVPTCILPWTGTAVDRDWCQAIKYNHGLYNQCTKERVAGTSFCKTCANQCTKNGTDQPDFGTVEDRAACGLFEYKAGKAQKPCLPLANVINKFGDVTRETIESEAARFGIEIPEEQWVAQVAKRGRPPTPDAEKKSAEPKEKKKRGRPAKKAKHQESIPAQDLIASLVADAMKSSEQIPVVSQENLASEPKEQPIVEASEPEEVVAAPKEPVAQEPVTEKPKKAKKAKLTDEEKAIRAAEKKAKKEAKEKALAEKKAKKEEKAIAEKKAAEEKAIAEKKAAEELKKEEVYDTETDDDDSESDSDEEDDEPVKVRKFEHDGTTYLRDENTNIIYDLESQDEVGIWNPETKSIVEASEPEEVVAAPKEQVAQEPVIEKLKKEEVYDAETDDDDVKIVLLQVKAPAKHFGGLRLVHIDEVAVKVRKFEHDGTTYLRDENSNIIYDLESQDEVGIWNPETKSIHELEDDE